MKTTFVACSRLAFKPQISPLLPALIASLMLAASQIGVAQFTIDEYFDPTGQFGYYGTLNNTPNTVVAIAVANDTLFSSDGNHEFYRVWATGLITESNWNAEKDVFAGAIGMASVPSFGTLFPGYSKAAVYWADDLLDPVNQALVAGLSWEPGTLKVRDPINQASPVYYSRPILPGDDASYARYEIGFYFQATSASSPFAAFTVSNLGEFGFVTGETQLIGVPEPGVAALMLLGFGCLLSRRIKLSIGY